MVDCMDIQDLPPLPMSPDTTCREDDDNASVGSNESEQSVMEPFETYEIKIKQLLESIGFGDFSVEPIQHGYGFQNCVYALNARGRGEQGYILRIAIDGFVREDDGVHETMEDDVAVLDYLHDKLPVAQVVAYSAKTDNVLEAAYSIQTRMPGESLDHVWATMEDEGKYQIVDEFIELLATTETTQFDRTGILATPNPGLTERKDFCPRKDITVRSFEPNEKSNSIVSRENIYYSVKAFLAWHLNVWIQEEIDRGDEEEWFACGPKFEKLLAMLDDLDHEGAFDQQSSMNALHHWDLEPRNMMVSQASGAWKMCGIIDWDKARSFPKPLARVPPRWIWNFLDEEDEPGLDEGFLYHDQFPDPELSDKNQALKAYFDRYIEKRLPGYCEDAYGSGRWLRRIWFFADEGAFRTWEWPFWINCQRSGLRGPSPRLRSTAAHCIGFKPRLAEYARLSLASRLAIVDYYIEGQEAAHCFHKAF